MSIKIKKSKLVIPFLFLALSQVVFAGGYENDQMKTVEQTFFDCSHQVKENFSPATLKGQYERFQATLTAGALSLEARANEDAQTLAKALRSLEAKMKLQEEAFKKDWGKFSAIASADLAIVSHNMELYHAEFQQEMSKVGVAIEKDAFAFNAAMKDAAHQAAINVQTDILATEKNMNAWGLWMHAKLIEAKNTAVVDWDAFSKEVVSESNKYGIQVEAAAETTEANAKIFFQSLAGQLEVTGSKAYYGIEHAYSQLEEKIQLDWKLAAQYFVDHVENQAVAGNTRAWISSPSKIPATPQSNEIQENRMSMRLKSM